MFIGTSPEFELALYTVCFLGGQEENVVEVGDYQVKIKAHRINSKYGAKVGSCYPEVSQPVHLTYSNTHCCPYCRLSAEADFARIWVKQ